MAHITAGGTPGASTSGSPSSIPKDSSNSTDEAMAALLPSHATPSSTKDGDPHPKKTASPVPLAVYGVVAGAYAGLLPGETKWAWFSWHPLAMTIAFVSLTATAALIKQRGGYENTKLHGELMAAAIVLALFGYYVIYSNKNMLGKDHLTSYHGKYGALALVSYLALFAVGLGGLHPDLGALRTDRRVRAVHKWGGQFAAVLSWLVCVVGFANKHPDFLPRLCFSVPLAVGAYFVFFKQPK